MKKNPYGLFGLRRLLPELRSYRTPLVLMLLTSAFGSIVDIGVPLFQRYALNHFVALGTLEGFPLYLFFYLAVILVSALLNYISCIYGMKIEVGVDMDLRNAAFSHLQTLSFSYYNQNSVGYIHARVMSDTSRIGELCSWALPVIAILPVTVLLFSLFQRRLTLVNREIREVNSRITGNFNEGITGARTIKSLVIEERMEKDFVADTEDMRRKSVRAARLRGLFSSTMHFASSMALALVLWKGGYIAATQIGT